MSGTHGDLFREIGALVVAAHRGAAIDLSAQAGDLAERYMDLGVPADTLERAIARSIGAVCVGSAIVSSRPHDDAASRPQVAPVPLHDALTPTAPVASRALERAPSPFPSGLRLAVLS